MSLPMDIRLPISNLAIMSQEGTAMCIVVQMPNIIENEWKKLRNNRPRKSQRC